MPVLRGASIPGKCSVCKLLFHLVPSTGILRRYGFVGSFPACVGSGLLPDGVLCDDALVKNLDEGMCCSPTSPSTSESSAAESVDSFTIHLPSYQLIKRIPRAVRGNAASIFQACLRDVVSGGTVFQWKRLLNFSSALRQH